jgi:hypothetical protein
MPITIRILAQGMFSAILQKQNKRTHRSRKIAIEKIRAMLEVANDDELTDFIEEQRRFIIAQDKWSFRRFRPSNFLILTKNFLEQAEIIKNAQQVSVRGVAKSILEFVDTHGNFDDISSVTELIDTCDNKKSSNQDIINAAKNYQHTLNKTWFKFHKFSKIIYDKIYAFILLAPRLANLENIADEETEAQSPELPADIPMQDFISSQKLLSNEFNLTHKKQIRQEESACQLEKEINTLLEKYYGDSKMLRVFLKLADEIKSGDANINLGIFFSNIQDTLYERPDLKNKVETYLQITDDKYYQLYLREKKKLLDKDKEKFADVSTPPTLFNKLKVDAEIHAQNEALASLTINKVSPS